MGNGNSAKMKDIIEMSKYSMRGMMTLQEKAWTEKFWEKYTERNTKMGEDINRVLIHPKKLQNLRRIIL